jgi:hypothetical protein
MPGSLQRTGNARHDLGVHPAIPNYRELGMLPSDPYSNSGVLVMDLQQWRADDITRSTLEILDRHRRHVL